MQNGEEISEFSVLETRKRTNGWSLFWQMRKSRAVSSHRASPEVASSHPINCRKVQKDAFQTRKGTQRQKEETWWKVCVRSS